MVLSCCLVVLLVSFTTVPRTLMQPFRRLEKYHSLLVELQRQMVRNCSNTGVAGCNNSSSRVGGSGLFQRLVKIYISIWFEIEGCKKRWY